MTQAQYLILVDRKRRSLEYSFTLIFKEVFLKQLSRYQRALERTPFDAIYTVEKFFPESDLIRPYTAMITQTANEFKFESPVVLRKEIAPNNWVTMVSEYVRTIGGQRITEITNFTKTYVLGQLQPILEDGVRQGFGIDKIARNIINRVDEYKDRFSTYRAERIARTEIVGTSNWASLNSAQAAGVSDQIRKKWHASTDGREREWHREMNSKPAIALDQEFQVRNAGGQTESLAYPGDPKGSKSNVINCRCTVIYVRV